jgi:hypothetical protein
MSHLPTLLRHAWNVTNQTIEDWLAIKAAANEAVESQLPGRENGPADAYRHLLWGAELTRRFGAHVARGILEDHETQADLSTSIGRDGQTPEAAAMDRHDNELAIALGERARTWNEVKQGAQDSWTVAIGAETARTAAQSGCPKRNGRTIRRTGKPAKSCRHLNGTGRTSTGSKAECPILCPTSIPTGARSIATSRRSMIPSRWLKAPRSIRSRGRWRAGARRTCAG